MQKIGAMILAAAIATLLACVGHPNVAPSNDVPRARDYMSALREAEAKSAATEGSLEDPQAKLSRTDKSLAMQLLGVAQSMVGDTVAATSTFDEVFGVKQPDSIEQKNELARDVSDVLRQYTPEDALAAIMRAASGRQIVIINEAHHVPRHRAFAMRVALELRKQGFQYLAMETLAENVDALNSRGYPLERDGTYVNEPVFGDYVRQTLGAGYKLVAYEQKYDPATAPKDPIEGIGAREEAQAQNLVDRIFAKNAAARVLIHVGYGHIAKGEMEMPGNVKMAWMAERLKRKTGIDPLCINQTEGNASLIRSIEHSLFATRSENALVLSSQVKGDDYWPQDGTVDMQVFQRPERIVNGRPDWLSIGGYRVPRVIPSKLLPQSGRRLVQAFFEDESPNAVPVDQVIVIAGKPVPVLMLPKGKFRFAYQD